MDQSGKVDVYSNPDIIVKYLNNDPAQQLVVEIIVPYGGNLQISSIYKNGLNSDRLAYGKQAIISIGKGRPQHIGPAFFRLSGSFETNITLEEIALFQ